MVYFVHIFILFFFVIETTRIIILLDLDYDDFFYRLFAAVSNDPTAIARLTDVEGLNDTVFDQCILRSNPIWSEDMKRILNPHFDPLKNCDRSYRPWSSLNSDGQVTIRSEFGDANCRARALLLKDEYNNSPGEWHDITEKFVFETDIVEVECKRGGKVAYKFIHSQIWTRDNSRTPTASSSKGTKESPPSVYIMLMDSFGASHAKRVFPKTLEYLKDEFGAIEMHHVNKVGENSRPNAFPFLFGKTVQSIYRDMWGRPNIKADLDMEQYCDEYLDNEPLVIKDFEKKGYKTMMAEDWAQGVFNWPACKGYKKPPTTHYMRPFQLEMATSTRQLIDHQGKSNCFEPHHFLNDYMQQFLKAYPNSPKFGLNWDSSLGHDYSNEPFHADGDYLQFFKRNREEFDNSFLFFMGDHGLRFGKMSDTPEGRRDVSNPMMHISVPKRLRNDKTLIGNLKKNSNELLTMFDLHATFVDILETFTESKTPDFTKTVGKDHLKGTSMFRPLPPGDRNCKTLPIPFQYCICHLEKKQIPATSAFSGMGKVIAEAINTQLKKYKVDNICAMLESNEITDLKLVMGSSDLYQVTARVRPSGGVYQTFVRGSHGNFKVVSPDVTRLDSYGSQADCIDHNEIRPLCFCQKSQVRRFFFGTFLD